MCKELKLKFGNNWSFTTDRVGKILNRIYNVEAHRSLSNSALIKYNFYKNIYPKSAEKKKVTNVYEIKSLVTVEDLINKLEISIRKKELTTTISSNLNYVISKKVNSKLFENEIELISSIF